MKILLLLLAFSDAAIPANSSVERAKKLKDILNRQKPEFEERESRRKDVLSELDELNSEQNQVRQRVASYHANIQELNMASDNLSLELQNQIKMENLEKQQLVVLLKLAYRVQRDGVLKFLIQGRNLSQLSSRARVLYRTLRSQSSLTRQLEERALRLQQGEQKLSQAKEDLKNLVKDLSEQEEILSTLLTRKKQFLARLNDQQNSYQIVSNEYKKLSQQLNEIFSPKNSEEAAPATTRILKAKGKLLPPLEEGKLVKTFGKTIHEKFGTVLYQKGIEIEANHEAEVRAVLGGTVEYQGWVRGLGNVVILKHPGGYYSLNAHLFKATKDIGQQVAQGDVIGLVGDTGDNDKPSLYFEFREKGKAVDPLAFFEPKKMKHIRRSDG